VIFPFFITGILFILHHVLFGANPVRKTE
jgi:hypothetical protein